MVMQVKLKDFAVPFRHTHGGAVRSNFGAVETV